MWTSFVIVVALLAKELVALPEPRPQGKKGGGGGGGGACKKVTFIFARGTTEPGTMGSTVGPALSRALGSKFPGQVTTLGVSYPADFQGAFSGGTNPGGAKGALDMTRKAKSALQRCPNTKIVLCGYSQGAEQVHGALMKQNLGDLGQKIAAAITYGDPLAVTKGVGPGGWGCLPQNRGKIFCSKGDGVCGGAFSISAAHMSYTSNGDIGKGASFAAQFINMATLPGAKGGKCDFGPSSAEILAKLCADGGSEAKAMLSKAKKGAKKGSIQCPPKGSTPAKSPKPAKGAEPKAATSPAKGGAKAKAPAAKAPAAKASAPKAPAAVPKAEAAPKTEGSATKAPKAAAPPAGDEAVTTEEPVGEETITE